MRGCANKREELPTTELIGTDIPIPMLSGSMPGYLADYRTSHPPPFITIYGRYMAPCTNVGTSYTLYALFGLDAQRSI